MNRIRFAPLALALFALAACGKSGDEAGNSAKAAPVASVAAPDGKQWSDQIVATDEGVRMGNPNAPLKVIEYGSYTCPHCRDFQAEAHEPLVENYVDTGKISFEYRNLIRDAFDLTAALVAHCPGPDAFFAMNNKLFANQNDMVAHIQSYSQAAIETAMKAPPKQRFINIAKLGNLIEFAKQNGMTEEQVKSCLSDDKKAQQIVDTSNSVLQKYPQFPGTPSFIINGVLQDNTASWATLKARLSEAGA